MGQKIEVKVLKRSKEQRSPLNWNRQLWQEPSGQGAIEHQRQYVASAQNLPQRIVSSKQLDLLLLAACSCLLTLLCHPVMNVQFSTASSSAVQSSLPSTTSQINFYVKSALMSSFQEKDRQGEGSQDEG